MGELNFRDGSRWFCFLWDDDRVLDKKLQAVIFGEEPGFGNHCSRSIKKELFNHY